MENFTNTTIDLSQLPQFETVQFQKLQASYWKVIMINFLVTFLLLGVGIGVLSNFIPEITEFSLYLWITLAILGILNFAFSRIAFLKKGFAFREHDVLYRYG